MEQVSRGSFARTFVMGEKGKDGEDSAWKGVKRAVEKSSKGQNDSKPRASMMT